MARWVDVRVEPTEVAGVMRALGETWPGVTMTVDTKPNRASDSPEWNVEVKDRTEAEVLAALEGWGVHVLATRERLSPGACAIPHPETGEACSWPHGHLRALIDPICVRDGRGALVDHSWAVPPIMGQLRIQWVA